MSAQQTKHTRRSGSINVSFVCIPGLSIFIACTTAATAVLLLNWGEMFVWFHVFELWSHAEVLPFHCQSVSGSRRPLPRIISPHWLFPFSLRHHSDMYYRMPHLHNFLTGCLQQAPFIHWLTESERQLQEVVSVLLSDIMGKCFCGGNLSRFSFDVFKVTED